MAGRPADGQPRGSATGVSRNRRVPCPLVGGREARWGCRPHPPTCWLAVGTSMLPMKMEWLSAKLWLRGFVRSNRIPSNRSGLRDTAARWVQPRVGAGEVGAGRQVGRQAGHARGGCATAAVARGGLDWLLAAGGGGRRRPSAGPQAAVPHCPRLTHRLPSQLLISHWLWVRHRAGCRQGMSEGSAGNPPCRVGRWEAKDCHGATQ